MAAPDPFVTALIALFNAPGSAAAVYTPKAGPAFDTRVICSSPDQEQPFGDGKLILPGVEVQLLREWVPAPADGDLVAILRDGIVLRTLVLRGEPLGDVEQLSWTMSADEG